MPIVEYDPSAAFPGVIGRTADESSPAWPAPVRAAEGAPNVLFIVLDDTGFGQLGCYGSPIDDARTWTGSPRTGCGSTTCTRRRCARRVAVVHRDGPQPSRRTGWRASRSSRPAIPGYNGVIPFENGMLSEMLLEHGYSTFMVGKWHLTPSNQETAAGPYDRWPLGRGFQRFYGFLGGDTSQWYPELVYDNHQVEPPKKPEEGYHLSEDLVDKAVSFIADSKQADPQKPFYLHLCFGATHAPHHVAKEWADKYKGVFDDGWDAYREKTFARQKELGIVPADAELSRHDPDVPDWDALPDAGEDAVRSRMMEVFAGFLEHTDHQVGRLLEFLTKLGELENTLIMVDLRQRRVRGGRPDRDDERGAVLQQRAGADRGEPDADRRDRRPEALQPLPVGLDVGRQHPVPPLEARDLPRRRLRPVHRLLAEGDQEQGRGATAVRAHHRHGADRARPARHRAAGDDPGRHPVARSTASASPTPSTIPRPRRRHHTQYFEMMGHRAIYHDGWRAVCPWPGPSFTEAGTGFGNPISADTLSELDATGWELYHVAEDFAENHERGRGEPRQADRDDRHLVRRGRASTR